MARALPLAVIRLYPEPRSRLHVRVAVWPTLKAMRSAATWDRLSQRTLGFCSGVTKQRKVNGTWRTDPVFAEVHLAARRLSTEIITHELMHATMAFGRRIRFEWNRIGDDDAVNDQEERLCHAHGRMVRQLVDRLGRAGVYGAVGCRARRPAWAHSPHYSPHPRAAGGN